MSSTEDFMEVTEDELKAFIQGYGKPLEKDVFRALEPPLVTYNDFTLGNWPESIVAKYFMGDPPESSDAYYGPASGFSVRKSMFAKLQ